MNYSCLLIHKEDKKKLIAGDLVQFIDKANSAQLLTLSREEAKDLVKEFSGFTTYFVGFHQNRENMYSAEEKSTGIAYRLINENLPKFIDNIVSFKKIMEVPEMAAKMEELTSVRDNRVSYVIIMLRVYTSSPRHQA